MRASDEKKSSRHVISILVACYVHDQGFLVCPNSMKNMCSSSMRTVLAVVALACFRRRNMSFSQIIAIIVIPKETRRPK